MSLDFYGMDSKLGSKRVFVEVSENHPLIRVANTISWKEMADLVMEDLKKTTHGFWWLGRKLLLRVHLAVLILQSRFQLTDRQMEEELRYNGLFQVFAGSGIVRRWRFPDHTSIQKFRSRLSPETIRKIALMVIKSAEACGYADASWMDVDSTVQSANISYPSDANLLLKLAKKTKKVIQKLITKTRGIVPKGFSLEIKDALNKSKEYFFLKKQAGIEKKRECFKNLHSAVRKSIKEALEIIEKMKEQRIKKLPSRLAKEIFFIKTEAKEYLLDVTHFIRTHTIKKGKLLSFHAKQIACISKGKLGKSLEFGRVFQLGRIGGNFLIPFQLTSVRMEDKRVLPILVKEHQKIFGKGTLKSIGTDRGYYSKRNERACVKAGVKEIGLQKPGKAALKISRSQEKIAQRLRDRRAGIEPLIGHAKNMGLARSRMKSDIATMASGYRSVLGFNLRQLERHTMGMMKIRAVKCG